VSRNVSFLRFDGVNYKQFKKQFNPLNAKFNPICHLLALLGPHHIFHVSGLRVKQQASILKNGKPEGRRPVEKTMREWDDNIKVNHTEYSEYIWLRKGASGGML